MRNFRKYKHKDDSMSVAVDEDVPDVIEKAFDAVNSLPPNKNNFSRRVEILEKTLSRRQGAVVIAVLLDRLEVNERAPISTEGMPEELVSMLEEHYESLDTCMCDNCVDRRAIEGRLKEHADAGISKTSGEGGHC